MRYEANPKHKPMPSPGRRGSICPDEANADQLLRDSVQHGNKRYATDGKHASVASATTRPETPGMAILLTGTTFRRRS